jgi:acyl-CoA thioesterase-1
MVSVLMVCGVLIGCSSESPTPVSSSGTSSEKADDGFGTIVAVGDSLTAGYGVDERQAYPALLQERLLKEGYFFRVVNAGISGETSSGTRSRIAWVMSALKPDVIILETGANDGLRGIETAVLEKNLTEIIAAIQAEGVAVILAGMKMPPNFGRNYTKQFAEVYPRVATKMGIALIPFFLEDVAGDRRYNLADGIHPNPEGYRRVVAHIYPYVIKAIEHLSNER